LSVCTNSGAFPAQVLQNASGMYRNMNSMALRLTKRGGLVMTCSCSGAMTQSGMFLRVLYLSLTQKGTFPTFYLSKKKSVDKKEKCKFYNIEVRLQPQVLGNK
jgi:23S rRNA G2069 N7-methylase RlmK/C1962 C5-methylase RlmI